MDAFELVQPLTKESNRESYSAACPTGLGPYFTARFSLSVWLCRPGAFAGNLRQRRHLSGSSELGELFVLSAGIVGAYGRGRCLEDGVASQSRSWMASQCASCRSPMMPARVGRMFPSGRRNDCGTLGETGPSLSSQHWHQEASTRRVHGRAPRTGTSSTFSKVDAGDPAGKKLCKSA